MNEKLSNMWTAFKGLYMSTMVTSVTKPLLEFNIMLYLLASVFLTLAMVAIQALVFIIILFPLGVLYVFGLPISAGISLWRIIKKDYGNTGESANMKPALDVLYSLAVVQGALFCYRAGYVWISKGLAKDIADWYKFKNRDDLVWDYLRETRIGCQKDPSFATGRNLITYAVNLMNSMSPDNYISGVRILGTIIKYQKIGLDISLAYQGVINGQNVLIKHLLTGSASSGHMLQNLLWTLDSSSPYDRKTVISAVRILEIIAGGIRLNKFPGGTECIADLLDTHGCELTGLRILGGLAAAGEENCIIISNTPGLLSRIMAPVTSDLLHNSDHFLCRDIVGESLKVMERLMTGPGETSKKLRLEVASNKEVINSTENILNCGDCDSSRKQLVMGVLEQLCIDTSVSVDTGIRKHYVNSLLRTFVFGNFSSAREQAGQKLATIASKNISNAMVILDADDEDLDNLIAVLLKGNGTKYRIIAAEILKQLCIPYIKNNEHLNKLNKFKTDVLPKVLREILCCRLPEEHARGGAENEWFAIQGTDIEEQGTLVSQKDDRDATRARKQEGEGHIIDMDLLEALLSLSVSIFDQLFYNSNDLAILVADVAPGDDQFILPRKLKEMVERYSEHTTDCLKILKLIGMMVISMMKHTSFFLRAELDNLLQALSNASENMRAQERFMVFEKCSDRTGTKKPLRTLVSLVKEAQDIMGRNYGQGSVDVDYIE